MTYFLRLLAVIAVLVAPDAALAHTGTAGSFVHAFAHPFTGLDHVVVMTLVGVYAAVLGGQARWLLPVVFVTSMGLGLAIGATALPFSGVEAGIVLSVLALGALLLSGAAAPLPVVLIGAGAAAVFHGYAHGSELAGSGSALPTAAGALAGTAVLHGLGLGFILTFGSEQLRQQAAACCGVLALLAGGWSLLA
jgi:urease accessory protein